MQHLYKITDARRKDYEQVMSNIFIKETAHQGTQLRPMKQNLEFHYLLHLLFSLFVHESYLVTEESL